MEEEKTEGERRKKQSKDMRREKDGRCYYIKMILPMSFKIITVDDGGCHKSQEKLPKNVRLILIGRQPGLCIGDLYHWC